MTRPWQIQFAALGIVCVAVVTRLPSLLHPLHIDDEAIYSVVATEIVDGGRPYVDAVERKPPLLFYTYAAVFEIAGNYNWPALHVFALVWTLGIMAGLYCIGRQLFDRETGFVGALFYAIFQHWGPWKNLTLDGEMLMNLPIVWAWAIALRQTAARFRAELFVSGALLAAAFLLKQPALIAAVPLGIYLLLPAYRASRQLSFSRSVAQCVTRVAGFTSVIGLVAFILSRQGILGDAIYWTILDHDVPHIFWAKGTVNTLSFAAICLPLVLGILLSLQDRHRLWIDKRAEQIALLGLFIASAIGVLASGRFYSHYYIQLLPPMIILAAPYYAAGLSNRIQPAFWFLRRGVTFVWLGLIVVVSLIAQWIGLSHHTQPSESGKYLFEHSNAADRAFVWGQASRIYLDAQRRPACRYIETYPLTGYVFGGPIPGIDTRRRILPGAWDHLEQDFAKHPPVYIVDVHDPTHAAFPIREFPVLANLIDRDYVRETETSDGIIYRKK